MGKVDGGPAFPTLQTVVKEDEEGYREELESSGGMTLRDWFAGQALQGILSSESNPTLASARRAAADRNGLDYSQQVALEAYTLSDLLLAEREK